MIPAFLCDCLSKFGWVTIHTLSMNHSLNVSYGHLTHECLAGISHGVATKRTFDIETSTLCSIFFFFSGDFAFRWFCATIKFSFAFDVRVHSASRYITNDELIKNIPDENPIHTISRDTEWISSVISDNLLVAHGGFVPAVWSHYHGELLLEGWILKTHATCK